MPVWIQRFLLNSVLRFSFFSFSLTSRAFQETTSTVASLFITIHVLKNIKNGSYDTIYTFKNYFATVFSVFSFSNNKFNPNGSIVCVWIRIISSCVCVFWLFFFGFQPHYLTKSTMNSASMHCSWTQKLHFLVTFH